MRVFMEVSLELMIICVITLHSSFTHLEVFDLVAGIITLIVFITLYLALIILTLK